MPTAESERLSEALNRQEEMFATVVKMERKNRSQFWGLVGLSFLMIAVVVLLFWTWGVAHKANDTSLETRANTAQIRAVINAQHEKDLEHDVQTCRIRNEANRNTRRQFRIDHAALLQIDPQNKALRRIVRKLDAAITPATRSDRDCDGDGHIADPGDYPDN